MICVILFSFNLFNILTLCLTWIKITMVNSFNLQDLMLLAIVKYFITYIFCLFHILCLSAVHLQCCFIYILIISFGEDMLFICNASEDSQHSCLCNFKIFNVLNIKHNYTCAAETVFLFLKTSTHLLLLQFCLSILQIKPYLA